jgi:hypothetical protein
MTLRDLWRAKGDMFREFWTWLVDTPIKELCMDLGKVAVVIIALWLIVKVLSLALTGRLFGPPPKKAPETSPELPELLEPLEPPEPSKQDAKSYDRVSLTFAILTLGVIIAGLIYAFILGR